MVECACDVADGPRSAVGDHGGDHEPVVVCTALLAALVDAFAERLDLLVDAVEEHGRGLGVDRLHGDPVAFQGRDRVGKGDQVAHLGQSLALEMQLRGASVEFGAEEQVVDLALLVERVEVGGLERPSRLGVHLAEPVVGAAVERHAVERPDGASVGLIVAEQFHEGGGLGRGGEVVVGLGVRRGGRGAEQDAGENRKEQMAHAESPKGGTRE